MSTPRDILCGLIFKCSLNLLSTETKCNAFIRKFIFSYRRLFCESQASTPGSLQHAGFLPSHIFLGKK